MVDVIQTRSTSRNTAIASDIILREGPLTRLVFRPMILNNPNNASENVKGTFVYQRKQKNERWEDYSESSLKQVKSGEGISLELSSSEVHKLIEELPKLYSFAAQHGVVMGEHKFPLTNANISGVIEQIVENPGYLTQIVDKNGWQFLQQSLQWLANNVTTDADQKRLLGLDKNSLTQVNAAISMAKMHSTLDLLEAAMAVDDENHWHSLFKANPWLLSQLFPYPVALFEDKAYVGGKAINDKGGNLLDFLYKNKLTENSVLIEIKKPGTPLLGAKYRNDSYGLSHDLTGGIGQLLSYRDSLMKNSAQLLAQTKEDLRVYYPKCVLIIGRYSEIANDESKIATFERFRANLNWLEIVTFDELLNRIKCVAKILKGGALEAAQPPVQEDDFPF